MTTSLKALREKNREAVISRVADKLRELADRSRIERIYLFGSWARGDFDGYSDIDLLVVLKSGASEDEVALDGVRLDPEHAVELVYTNPERYRQRLERNDPFFTRIEHEKQLLWAA